MTRRYWNIHLEEMMEAGVHLVMQGGKNNSYRWYKKESGRFSSIGRIRARCHYVNKKWLGGMSTNWSTTETRLRKFNDLRAEQKAGRLNQEEYTALRECVTLGIPTIYISIPANDDARASIRLILNKLVSAICEGRSSYIRNR
ncbi:hypothetical protein AQUCO_03800149v1 [Aquilegia coerulea]|uniref:Small ribosomal subunit protein uS2c n=1 Tax=Aquilegia coerulea TaxID=218851 RepID=A0A2G5CST6_AQUCA|nr:hypothetical protein AQUCO_03800149v1 [Aquilegia coerulea]